MMEKYAWETNLYLLNLEIKTNKLSLNFSTKI